MSRRHRKLDQARWRAVRRRVLRRDGFTCRHCGKYGKECDHIVPLHVDDKQDPYAPSGLQCLCRGCHIAKTRRENRRPPTPDEAAWQRMVAEIMEQ